MTRRTFIAFLAALLPANWLRPTVEPLKIKPLKARASGSSEDTARMCGAFDGRDAHREWLEQKLHVMPDGSVVGYGGVCRVRYNGYSEPPTVTITNGGAVGLCDLAYRKP